MFFTEQIDQLIIKYNKSQFQISKRKREEYPDLPEHILEDCINIDKDKNRKMFAIYALYLDLKLRKIESKTLDELQDFAIALAKIDLFVEMIISGKELNIDLPDLHSDDPKDKMQVETLMEKYPDVDWIMLMIQ